jgi:hypothetical protein
MIELGGAEWFHIRGRGDVAGFHGIKGFDPYTLVGQRVIIDGVEYPVRGVETHPVNDPTGHDFGILVGKR